MIPVPSRAEKELSGFEGWKSVDCIVAFRTFV